MNQKQKRLVASKKPRNTKSFADCTTMQTETAKNTKMDPLKNLAE